jgi:hypothetical protein
MTFSIEPLSGIEANEPSNRQAFEASGRRAIKPS